MTNLTKRASFTKRDGLRAALALGAGLAGCAKKGPATTLLNVSYDPTRELYADINKVFRPKDGDLPAGNSLAVEMSHGGSGKQARAVIDGLKADVVTLALAYDIDKIAATGLINKDWQARLPQNSAPYTSTIIFVVRKGNPKNIKDWGDLTKEGVQVITPNPKTGGGARWNYLAAWAWGLRNKGGEAGAEAFVRDLYKHVPVLDTGARGATTTFVQRGIGDVLISWENEAILAKKELDAADVELVYPTYSILAEPSVAVVDKNVDEKGTRKVAQSYLEFLYTEEAQDIIGKHYYRPRSATALAKYQSQFPAIELTTIDSFAGSWAEAQAKHFADGALFDQFGVGEAIAQ